MVIHFCCSHMTTHTHHFTREWKSVLMNYLEEKREGECVSEVNGPKKSLVVSVSVSIIHIHLCIIQERNVNGVKKKLPLKKKKSGVIKTFCNTFFSALIHYINSKWLERIDKINRKISEGSCDIEYWSNTWSNSITPKRRTLKNEKLKNDPKLVITFPLRDHIFPFKFISRDVYMQIL